MQRRISNQPLKFNPCTWPLPGGVQQGRVPEGTCSGKQATMVVRTNCCERMNVWVTGHQIWAVTCQAPCSMYLRALLGRPNGVGRM